MPHTVRVARVIDAPRKHVWDALTDPARIALWFADVSRFVPGEPFRFDFGDGDFFVGRTLQCDNGHRLGMVWRFMDVGPLFHIHYRLDTMPNGSTRVAVTDRGALLASDARSLTEGWADFLERLSRAVTTGASARFVWSPAIATAALLGDGVQPLAAIDDTWLESRFKDASIDRLEAGTEELVICFHEAAWGDNTTEARLTIHHVEGRTLMAVTHSGWDRLPSDIQLAERCRYAGRWAAALASLEAAVLVH